MENMDRMIYCQEQDGSFVRVGEPRGCSDRDNFLILYEGMDWSGFRTLSGCERQLPEIAARGRRDHFTVVERF
jgi:hypothetical protein